MHAWLALLAGLRPAGFPEVLECRRRLAVQRVRGGYFTPEVAEFVGVDPSSVCRWLAESPTAHAFACALWTGPQLARAHRRVVERPLPLRLSQHLAAAARLHVPEARKAREADDKAIATWLARDRPRIKKRGPAGGVHPAAGRERATDGAAGAARLVVARAPPGAEAQGRAPAVGFGGGGVVPEPLRDRLGLAFQTLVKEAAEFLSGALALDGPVVVIWDRGTLHQGDSIDDVVEKAAGRLTLEPVPPYASELMPVEYLWRWLKYDRLCNFAPRDAHDLNEAVLWELEPIRQNQELLASFFHQSDLPLPRAFLSWVLIGRATLPVSPGSQHPQLVSCAWERGEPPRAA